MLGVQILGLVLTVLGVYLILANVLGTEGKVQLPGLVLNVPSSMLVLVLGVAVFLYPLSPWWPGQPEASPTPGPTTTVAPSVEPSIQTPLESIETTIAPTATITAAERLPASVLTDCIGYDPASLALEDLGTLGWRLNSSTSAMLLADDLDDAQAALALAQLHSQRCFIGRDNSRPDRSRYIVTFWTGDLGAIVAIPDGAIPSEDCIGYDPDNLSIEDLGDLGWRLNSGPIGMVLADNQNDAAKLMELAAHYDEQCFIGRNNSREDRFGYIEDYWN
jgi:hypothetical protein